jgi:hypothetical protein
MKTNHSYLLGVYQSELNNVKIKIDAAMNAYNLTINSQNLLSSIEAIQALPFMQDKMNLEVLPFEFKVPIYEHRASSFSEQVELETKTKCGRFTVAMLAGISGYLDYDSNDDAYVSHPYFDIVEISVFDNEGTEVYNYDIDELSDELKTKLTITV